MRFIFSFEDSLDHSSRWNYPLELLLGYFLHCSKIAKYNNNKFQSSDFWPHNDANNDSFSQFAWPIVINAIKAFLLVFITLGKVYCCADI